MNRSKLEKHLETIHFFGCMCSLLAAIFFVLYMSLYQPISAIQPVVAIDPHPHIITYEHCIKHCEQYE